MITLEVVALMVGTLVPSEPQPLQIFKTGLEKFVSAASLVQVVVAENQSPLGLSGTLMGHQECAGVAQMQKASGGGSETTAIQGRP